MPPTESTDRETPPETKRPMPLGEAVFASLLAALGCGVVVGALNIPMPRAVDAFGPRTLPLVVGVLLIVVAVWILVTLALGKRGQAEDSEDVDLSATTSWATVGSLVGLIALHAVLITPLGWPIAAAILFFGGGLVLGARPWWKVTIIAIGLALLLQFLFAYLLGLSLPAGLLERVVFLHG